MEIEKAILPIKINELVTIVSHKKKMDIADAMSYILGSNFYKQLINPGTKWWYASGLILYRELEKEKRKQIQKENNQTKEQLFFIFCEEQYKWFAKMQATEVHELFQRYKVYEFLGSNYEVLHSQGENYILEEIKSFIKSHKQK